MTDKPVRQLLDTARKQLEDGDAMGCTHNNERFISQKTVERVFASKEFDKFNTNHRYQDTDDSLMLCAVALVARLDHYYVPLLQSGITDDILFDDDAFKARCQQANIPDADFDGLRSNRNRFGATICPEKCQNISKGVVLPYLKRKKVNQGSFGTVYRVEVAPGHLRGSNERVVAEKKIRSNDYAVGSKEEWDRLFREAVTLEKRKHANIIPLLASYFLKTAGSETDVKTLHLIFPFADKDLAEWMAEAPTQNPKEDELIRRDIYRKIHALMSGLSYLHREIAGEITSHHDIKASNILVFGPEFVLGDLGNSNLRPSYAGSKTRRNVLGTYEYHPPEYWDDSGRKADLGHGRAFDAWAIGCIIIELSVLIFYGWDSEMVAKFKSARLRSQGKRPLRLDDGSTHPESSFHNNMDVVDEWVEKIKYNGSSRVNNLLRVAEGLMAKDPRSRLYTWEAELDLYTIFDVDADLPKRLERNALGVQRPPPRIVNGTSTPLHRAAQTPIPERVQHLLKQGWPLFVQDADGKTAADLISQSSHPTVKSCLKPYKSVRAQNWRETHAFDLIRQGDKAKLETLLEEGIDWAAVDGNDHTLIHHAIQSGSTPILELILKFADGTQSRRRDAETGFTPLQEAATKDHPRHVSLIIDHLVRKQHPQTNGCTYSSDIEDRTFDGKTALFLAVERGCTAATEVLLGREAQIFTQCKQGNTPIHAIASTEDIAMEEVLVARVLKGDDAVQCLEHKNRLGQTPIELALLHQNFGCFRLLKKKGASMHTVNNQGENLLHIMAGMGGHHDFLEQFIDEFEPPAFEAEDHSGATPLMVAAKSHNTKSLALLENRRLRHTTGRGFQSSNLAANIQPNFYTLEAGEPWLSWHEPTLQARAFFNFMGIVKDFAAQFIYSAPDESSIWGAWRRLLRPPSDIPHESTHPKPFVLAILYMLHLEQSLKLKNSSGDVKAQDTISDKRLNILTRFDLWIGCQCSPSCGKEWNFVNRIGMYKPQGEQTPQCKPCGL
ncbi:MAG: hypothetical protein Q9178_004793 [Gyalolechia marmorata]